MAAFVIGWLSERLGTAQSLLRAVLVNVFGGIVVLYAFGTVGVALVAHLSLTAALVGNLIFLGGDIVKAVLAAVVARGVHQAMPGLLPTRVEREPAVAGV